MSAHNLPEQMAQSDWIIADPGDTGSIDVRKSGVCNMTSAAAETRTLPIPSFVGQWIGLGCDVFVGAITVTVTGGMNNTGSTTLAFGAAGTYAHLTGVLIAGVLRWRIDTVSTMTTAENVTIA